jgi:hypothetical protein
MGFPETLHPEQLAKVHAGLKANKPEARDPVGCEKDKAGGTFFGAAFGALAATRPLSRLPQYDFMSRGGRFAMLTAPFSLALLGRAGMAAASPNCH